MLIMLRAVEVVLAMWALLLDDVPLKNSHPEDLWWVVQ